LAKFVKVPTLEIVCPQVVADGPAAELVVEVVKELTLVGAPLIWFFVFVLLVFLVWVLVFVLVMDAETEEDSSLQHVPKALSHPVPQ